jgi:hypothetical protein
MANLDEYLDEPCAPTGDDELDQLTLVAQAQKAWLTKRHVDPRSVGRTSPRAHFEQLLAEYGLGELWRLCAALTSSLYKENVYIVEPAPINEGSDLLSIRVGGGVAICTHRTMPQTLEAMREDMRAGHETSISLQDVSAGGLSDEALARINDEHDELAEDYA